MENKNITLNLRFAEIKVIKYSQFDLEKDFKKDDKPLIEFQSNFQFKVLELEEKISCLVSVSIVMIETKEEFAELKVENVFEIKPFKDVVMSKIKNSYEIPNEILHNLVSISISTVRGILSEKLKGTIVQNEVYPLINPASLFENIKQVKL
uniref:hypothetical protein n=1 Tax=Gelidibacter sp. TaxID=2018083 RepID=UPI00404A92AE